MIAEPGATPPTQQADIGRSTPAPGVSAKRGAWEWWWRGRALEHARAMQSAGRPRVEREWVRRAERAAELADRALDPIDPLRSGPSVQLALTLYRQAVYWALRAHDAEAGAPASLAQVFDGAPSQLLLEAAGSEQELAALRGSLVERSFVEDAQEKIASAERHAHAAQAFVRGLLRLSASPEQQLRRVLWERRTRAGSLLLAFAILALGPIVYAVWAPGQDLAAGKPWRTSSKVFDCQPARALCGGTRTTILFHTKEENNPWFEIDLRAPTRVSVVEIENRKDCCTERAIPLAIEVSNDRATWRVVARRGDPFRTWLARFEPVTVHYVRARVERNSQLHLERVAVRER